MGRIVGIDLGTSTSEISCIVDGAPFVIPNSLDKTVTPSVVHIGDGGEILVGEPAAEFLFTRPNCTFMEVKRLTGSGKTLGAHGREYRPEELQGMLLRYLCDCAGEYLGETIDRAVITVPAYFTDVQRRLTAKAGEYAGLKVERIINEPTAAAMDYGLSNLTECKHILIYDFGGGTLDITVLELFNGVIDVKASRGNNKLGGKDFDEIIMRRLTDADPVSNDRTRLERLQSSGERPLSEITGDERALMRLKKAAEECKIALSSQTEYRVSLPFLSAGPNGKVISVDRTVTRAEFEEWIREKVESTRGPLMTVLSDGGLSPSDLDIILLVGGSTRIPCVKNFVADALSVIPQSLVDPELAVARGAAVQAGILEGVFSEENELILTDVCPYTLGVSVMKDGMFGEELVFDPLIGRNAKIPSEKSRIYSPYEDYQTKVLIEVYQGDSSDPDNNEFLGDVWLDEIPAARRGKEKVEVIFYYDMNGILQVKARVVSTGKEVTVKIDTAGAAEKPALDLSKWESAENARKFRPAIRKAQKIITAGDDKTGKLETLVIHIKEALIKGNEEHAEDLREILTDMMEVMEDKGV